MSNDVFRRVKDKMDSLSVGYATTPSGVEMKIIAKLFDEGEAEMYLNLTEDLQTGRDIAEKINHDTDEVEAVLRRMTEKGLTFPRFPKKEEEPVYYAVAPFFHGILEHQVNRMDPEMADLLEEFFEAGPLTRPVPGLRTIPVQTAVTPDLFVAPYDDVKAIVKKKDRIALADCVCSVWQENRGGTCERPKDVCMLFDFYGQYYVDLGMGRWVTQDEALAVLEKSEKAGLVAQFSFSENPEALCNCCPDCCASFRGIKKLPSPGLFIPTNYFAKVDGDLCTGSEICLDRCSMEAVTMNREDIAEIDLERCIGCGLCVSSCPVDAMSLERKPDDRILVPPKTGIFMKPSHELEDSIRT